MGLTEYILLALVILIPAALAVTVTLWSLKQASLRSAKGHKKWQPPVRSEPRDTPAVLDDEAVSKTS